MSRDTEAAKSLKNKSITMQSIGLNRIVNIYLNTTLAYGFVRAVTYNYENQKLYYNAHTSDFERKEMLVFDKIGTISFKTSAAVVAWPFMLRDDLVRLECAITGKDPDEYK